LLFGLKVPEDISVAKWPGHARYGKRAGKDNEGFLYAALFTDRFARPLEPYADRVAILLFEFGSFAKAIFPTLDDFLTQLDPFLAALPSGFRYGIEIRNPEYLKPGYFTLLASHASAAEGHAQGIAGQVRSFSRRDQGTRPADPREDDGVSAKSLSNRALS
jgi:hypothetical protein